MLELKLVWLASIFCVIIYLQAANDSMANGQTAL